MPGPWTPRGCLKAFPRQERTSCHAQYLVRCRRFERRFGLFPSWRPRPHSGCGRGRAAHVDRVTAHLTVETSIRTHAGGRTCPDHSHEGRCCRRQGIRPDTSHLTAASGAVSLFRHAGHNIPPRFPLEPLYAGDRRNRQDWQLTNWHESSTPPSELTGSQSPTAEYFALKHAQIRQIGLMGGKVSPRSREMTKQKDYRRQWLRSGESARP